MAWLVWKEKKEVKPLMQLKAVFAAAFFLAALLATANAYDTSAYDCGNPGSPTPRMWLRLNESTGAAGTTLYDQCSTDNDFIRNDTTERVAGIIDPAAGVDAAQQWYSGATGDGVYNYSTDAMGITTGNRSFVAWVKTGAGAGGTAQVIARVGRHDASAKYEYLMLYIDNINHFHLWCGTGATYREGSVAWSYQANTWYHVATVWNGTRWGLFINGSLNYSFAAADCAGQNGTFDLGSTDGEGGQSWWNLIDEATYYSGTALSDAQVLSLFNNNYINAAPVVVVGCNVTSVSPADASSTNDSTPTFTGSLTCYQSMATSCTLYANGSSYGTNSTLSNGSNFEITAAVMDWAAYQWNLSCTNTTYTNSSANRTLTVHACGNLTTANTVYTLTDNLIAPGACFNITSTNITLDCAGKYIYYAQTGSGNAVLLAPGSSNATIKNCFIVGNGTASTAITNMWSSQSNFTFFNNTIATAGYPAHAISLDFVTPSGYKLNVSFNTITTSNGWGININRFSSVNVTNNTVTTSTQYSIYLATGTAATVANNTVFKTGGSAVRIDAANHEILTNYITADVYPIMSSPTGTSYVINNTLNATGTAPDIYIGRGNVYAINNTYIGTGGKTYHDGTGTGTAYVQWYVGAHVYNCSNGTGIQNVNVTMYNNTGGAGIYNGLTDASGNLPVQVLTEYTEAPGGTKTYLNNYSYAAFSLPSFNNNTAYLNATSSQNFTFCMLTDWNPTVTLYDPVNHYNYSCWATPCNVTFKYNTTDEYGFYKAELWTNFTGVWALNQTNSTDIVNASINQFNPVSLGTGFYIWNVNVTDSPVTYNSSSGAANFSLLLAIPIVVICNGTYTDVVLNFSYANELTQGQLSGNMYGTFWIFNSDRTANQTLNLSSTNAFYVPICVWPPGATFLIDSFQTYEHNDTGYHARAYFLDNATVTPGAPSLITLYLLNSTADAQITITLQNQAGQQIEEALLYFARYYPGENLYKTVAMMKTSAEGTGSTWLQPNDAWYKITGVKNHALLYNWPSQQIPCDPSYTSCPITLTAYQEILGEWFSYGTTFYSSCVYTNATRTVACSFVDSSGLMKYARLYVYEVGVFANVLVYDANLTSSSGTLLYTLPENKTYTYVLTAHFADEVAMASGTITPLIAGLFGLASVGLLPALLIFLAFVGLGAWNPAVCVVTGFAGIMVSWAFGLLTIEPAAAISLGIIAGLIVYLVRT